MGALRPLRFACAGRRLRLAPFRRGGLVCFKCERSIVISAFKDVSKIDKNKFETLYRLPCPVEDICAYFVCTKDYLEDWCYLTYFMSLEEKLLQGEAIARIRLRQVQRDMAIRNGALTIWLGRQYLGQKNNPESLRNKVSDSSKLWSAIADSLNIGEEFTDSID
jgi:hypothetical protein